MASLNQLAAVTSSKNTGISTSFFDPKIIKGGFLCPKGYKIPLSVIAATLQAQMSSDANAASKSARIYPFGNLLDMKDNSEKAVEQTYGYGGKSVVRDGVYTWEFMFIKGGLTLLQSLRYFNGSAWDFLFVDQKNQLIGTFFTDVNNITYIEAIPSVQFYAQPVGISDGKKNADYLLQFSFEASYINENVAIVPDASFAILNTIKGLIDVNLTGVNTGASGTYTVSLKDNQGVNLYSQLNGTNVLAGTGKANWTMVRDVDGAAITITAVNLNTSADGGNGGFDVVCSNVDANYPGVGGSVRINLKDAGVLYTAGVIGFESAGYVKIAKN